MYLSTFVCDLRDNHVVFDLLAKLALGVFPAIVTGRKSHVWWEYI